VHLERLGDPEGMESLAAKLLLQADSVTAVLESLTRHVEVMTFEGPAASRLRDATEERRRNALRIAGTLEETAIRLKRSAAHLREQIAEERRRLRAEGPEL
jgi:muramoyltetrapeptide carboxypeptidase LdcA involved in peptidoglycan recycling